MGRVVTFGRRTADGDLDVVGRQDDDPGGIIEDRLFARDPELAAFASWLVEELYAKAYPVRIDCLRADAFGIAMCELLAASSAYGATDRHVRSELLGFPPRRSLAGEDIVDTVIRASGLTGEFLKARTYVTNRLNELGVATFRGEPQWFVLEQLFRVLWMASHGDMQAYLLRRGSRAPSQHAS